MFLSAIFTRKVKYITSVARAAQIQRIPASASQAYFSKRNLHRIPSIDEDIFFHNKKTRHKIEKNITAFRNSSSARTTTDDFDGKSFVDTEFETESTTFELKKMLYNETDDLMRQLNQCGDPKKLQEIIRLRRTEFLLPHYVQSVIVLWAFHLQNAGFAKEIDDSVIEDILLGLNQNISLLNINELSCCYLYLRKLDVPNTQPIMCNLLLKALKIIKESDLVDLPALSRLTIAISTGHDFYTPMVFADFLPHVLQHMKVCNSHESARLVAICLYNMHSLVDEEIIDAFKKRVQELLDMNVLNKTTQNSILKQLHLFNIPFYSNNNALLIRKLLLALRPSISELSEQEVKILSRIFQHHLEPAGLELELKEALESQMQVSPAVDTLACYMPFTEPTKRNHLISLFKKLLKSSEQWQKNYSDINFFVILRALKISETKVCDRYWDTILKRLESDEDQERYQQRFLRHCHRYMHFNNNLGGTYRFLPLERKLAAMAMDAADNVLGGSIPWKFARIAAFIFAYGHTPYSWKKFPNTFLSKIISMADQFSPTDCFYISRGIQICLEMRFRHDLPSTMSMQLATIDNILISCVERHVNSDDILSIQNLNTLVRTLNNRKTLKNSLVYRQAMDKYKTMDYSNLNSRTIRELAYAFTASNYIEPKALNAMFNYIEKEHEHVLGDTVEKVLTCAYSLGYVPDSLEVLECAAQVLIRDFDFMSGLSIVQACLALCYYKTIPETLINKVFCVNFIKRIEDEIHVCYSKATYPERVLNQVMQLNRTVCLDFPEANVPWFQQNYIEAQLSKRTIVDHKFSDEVKQLLMSLLEKETYFRCNHTTPYGYQIDFVIHFDQNRKPIPTPVETTMLDRITKVAILLLKFDSFCENDLTALRGPDSLKTKHLEMMGYKVLHINEHDWNSKYMAAPNAKTNYLKCLLQISN